MKTFGLLLLMFGVSAHASLEHCSSELMKDPLAVRSVEFLRTIEGNHRVGECTLEIHVCGDVTTPMAPDDVVGDLLVTDKYGQKFYVTFDLSRAKLNQMSFLTETGLRRMHYESIEHIPDSQNGRTEAYRVDLVRASDLSEIQRFELGAYTSKLKEEYPFLPKAKSYWVICR